jgi:hypothetical protein
LLWLLPRCIHVPQEDGDGVAHAFCVAVQAQLSKLLLLASEAV